MKKMAWMVSVFLLLFFLMPAYAVAANDTGGGQQTIDRQNIIDVAAARIRQMVGMPTGNEDLTVLLDSNPQDQLVPAGGVTMITELPYGIRYSTPTTVIVDIVVDGRLVARPVLKFDVRLYRQVLVTARTIGLHDLITADSLRYQRLDIGRLTSGYYTEKDKLIGLAVRRSLPPGLPITDDVLIKPILVKCGSMVTILAHIGDLEVQTFGQALQNGAEGQLIRVRNSSSGRILTGRVIDASEVEVIMYALPG
jgi:flagella basal body P-ring formation protein FlgA